MNFKFTFKGVPPKTHCFVHSGLACWYNQEQVVWIDFKNFHFPELFQESDEIISSVMLYHINLAVVHGLIDQHMFYGECKNEGWDPLHMWNIKLILGMGMGDYQIHTFNELFEYEKYIEPQSVMGECDFRTGELKIPYHYHKKRN